jgi:hypothetical protein
MAMVTVDRILRTIYKLENRTHNKPGAWKYPTAKKASLEILKLGKSIAYGEIDPESWHWALRTLKIRGEDVFADLGSGVAKVVVQTALESKCKENIAYEIVPDRHADAVCALSELAKTRPRAATRIKLLGRSFLNASLDNVTVVYVNNYLFQEPLFSDVFQKLNALPRLRTVVCMKAPCTRHTALCHKRGRPCAQFNAKFKLESEMRCDVSWAKAATLLVYTLRA